MNLNTYMWMVSIGLLALSIGIYWSYKIIREYWIIQRTNKRYEHVMNTKHLMSETEYMFEMYCIQYDMMIARGDKPIVKTLH